MFQIVLTKCRKSVRRIKDKKYWKSLVCTRQCPRWGYIHMDKERVSKSILTLFFFAWLVIRYTKICQQEMLLKLLGRHIDRHNWIINLVMGVWKRHDSWLMTADDSISKQCKESKQRRNFSPLIILLPWKLASCEEEKHVPVHSITDKETINP